MTQKNDRFDAYGRPATGIPPIICPPWCKDPGHIGEHSTDDQNCYSAGGECDVKCSLSVEARPGFGACYSIIGAWAYRGFGRVPVIQLYVQGSPRTLIGPLRSRPPKPHSWANTCWTPRS